MANRRSRLQQAPQDRDLWQKLYYKHPKSYQRRRLEAIKLLWDGLKLVEACERLECDGQTLRKWVDLYLEGGFNRLLAPKVSGKKGKGRLTGARLRVFKYILLHKTPQDYGLEGYVWTLKLMKSLLKEKWGIQLEKSRLQEILDKELNLSHQKFHRDYLNADKGKQRAFVQDMQKRMEERQEDEVQIWFDEFSVSTRPQASYGWAEKNSAPTVPSDEKKESGTTHS